MSRLTDPAEIRALLHGDRPWSVYALGDLVPAAFANSKWFAPDLTLVYSGYGACILFAMGEASIPEALEAVSWPVHLQVRPAAMGVLDRLTEVAWRKEMWRMAWNGDRSGWTPPGGARRLTAEDVPALERLYSDGLDRGEAPDFFFPPMVSEGVFFGAFEGEELVAAAGTHLYAPSEGTAAIGNVYARRDRRGMGLGTTVTCATLAQLAHLETVGLNVRQDNEPAIRVYESLGFRKHCGFFEALAVKPR